MSCESVSRGNEDELQDHRPSNWRGHKQEDQEEAGKRELHIGKERLSFVAEPTHADINQDSWVKWTLINLDMFLNLNSLHLHFVLHF